MKNKNKMQKMRDMYRLHRLKETNSRLHEVQSVTGQLSCLHGGYSNAGDFSEYKYR